MSPSSANLTLPQLLARRLPVDLAITTAFNVVIAIALTYMIRVGSSFIENLVFSLCIGTLVLLFADGGRLALWREARPPRGPFIVLLAVSNTAGWYFGIAAATRILGIPTENFHLTEARSTSAFVVFFILTCGVISWFFWNRARLQELAARAAAEKARAAAIEKQAMQAQLQLLQAQIEPHMLFNTLATLQSLITLDPPRAQHMLEQLIHYLRATLSSSRADKTTLAQEFALMEAYLGLMSVRMGARLSYALELPPDLQAVPVPPMLLQPLVENAIKHGLEPKLDGGRITVRARRDGQRLCLSVADTGLGLEAAAANGSNGTQVGVANVRERLQALYGSAASFALVSNTPDGVLARLELPISS